MLMAAIKEYLDTVMIAYSVRSKAILLAFESKLPLADINATVNAAFDKRKKTITTGKDALKKSRKEARKTYKSDIKACKVPKKDAPDARNEKDDNNLL
jgi:hypothetical protein